MQTLNEDAAKDPLVKKVHDSYMGFKKNWDKWAGDLRRRLSRADPRPDLDVACSLRGLRRRRSHGAGDAVA